MLTIECDLIQTAALTALSYLVGRFLKQKITILQTFFIPIPVIGGLLFSFLFFLGQTYGLINLTFNITLQDFFMNLFFTTVGLQSSFLVLKSSGKQGLLLTLALILLVVLQDVTGLGLAFLLGIQPLLGLATGAISMSGGLGSALTFGPILESMGAGGASVAGVTAATAGLIFGSLIGGPVAKMLIDRYNLKSEVAGPASFSATTNSSAQLSNTKLFNGLLLILLTAGAGFFVTQFFLLLHVKMPYFVGCLFSGLIVRLLSDKSAKKLNHPEIEALGFCSLNIFLAMALMTLDIAQLISLALPVLIILSAQIILMMLFAYFVTFKFLGKTYDAAVMASAHCGVGLGQTSNAIANMTAIIEKHGAAKQAMFVFPIVIAIIIPIFNTMITTFMINFLPKFLNL